jgi:hypothetical protein
VPDKLGIYNDALLTYLDTRPLVTLSDARTERRALDKAWPRTMETMLEAGMWNFASRAQQWNPSDTAESGFAFQYAYEKPDDYVRLIKISDNEWMEPTLSNFSEEGDFFFADVDPLWVIYVSNDAQYGADLGKWPAAFATAFAAELAYRARGGVKTFGAREAEALVKMKIRLLADAQGKDAVNQAPTRLPAGRLVQARAGRSGIFNRMRRTPYA